MEDNLTNIVLENNVTQQGNSFENSTVVPQWFLGIYFIFILSGALVNFLYVITLARCTRNGTQSIILQISLVDAALLYVALIEIVSISQNTWNFSTITCQLYKGVEVLTNSLMIYLIICVNFHIISLWNLHKWEVQKNRKNPLTSCDADSNECLVTKHENANRIVTIDYRKRKNDVSVILPTILIWFLCLSLSLPNFTLSTKLQLKNENICSIPDGYYGKVSQYLLLVFRIFIPVPMLFLTLIILLVKLAHTSQKDICNVLTKKFVEIRVLVIFCIGLTVLFIATSLQRYVLYFVDKTSCQIEDVTTNLKLPPLYSNCLGSTALTYLTMLHYSACCFRAALYFCLVPKFKDLLTTRLVCNQ